MSSVMDKEKLETNQEPTSTLDEIELKLYRIKESIRKRSSERVEFSQERFNQLFMQGWNKGYNVK
jgi:hypothetical protein